MINKPIDASPHNCCVNKNDGEFTIRYDLPSNEYIDGYYIETFDLQTNEKVSSLNYTSSNPINYGQMKVTSSTLGKYVDGGEYGWSSFYWQTLDDKKANKYTILGGDVEKSEIYLRPESSGYEKKSNFSASLLWEDSTTGEVFYDSDTHPVNTIWEALEITESNVPTNGDAYEGSLEDYVGYMSFMCKGADTSLVSTIKSIGLGKCVIEVYNDDGVLATAMRVLAYGSVDAGDYSGLAFIVDNKDFGEQLTSNGCPLIRSRKDPTLRPKIYHYKHIELYNIDNYNGSDTISGIARNNEEDDEYYLIKNVTYDKYYYTLSVCPKLTTLNDTVAMIGQDMSIWDNNSANFNITPTYYFRVKSSPTISINDFSQLQVVDNSNVLNDIKCKFGINYDSSYSAMNYFYLYLSVLNPQSYTWEIKERSPMLFTASDTYEFVGLMNGQDYKISAVCTDKDGDEWAAEEIEFAVSVPIITTYDIPSIFNRQTTTIELSLGGLLDTYKDASLEFYRVLKDDVEELTNLQYAGGGLAKTLGLISFDKWIDYNIRNDSYYDYYIRVEYTGKETDTDQGVDLFLAITDIHTEFEGTSILGLEKTSDSNLAITSSFNLLYHFEKEMGELTNEMSREYINTFNKYPKELKGHQNYISGSCSGLLGSECSGIYEEPKGIRKAWNKFVNDDTTKLYRGLDGETMIISIETSRVKPFFFPSVGLVNEVYITFKEIAPTNQLAIFRTEKMGD